MLSLRSSSSEGFVVKLNNYGDTLWKKLINGIGAYAVVPTNDGGCVLTGRSDSSFTIKLSSSGNTIWQKFYSVNANGLLGSLYHTSDGFFIACGYDFGSLYFKGVVMKIDSIGNLIWERLYTTNGDKHFGSIAESIDR
jgi:hypothetical protein